MSMEEKVSHYFASMIHNPPSSNQTEDYISEDAVDSMASIDSNRQRQSRFRNTLSSKSLPPIPDDSPGVANHASNIIHSSSVVDSKTSKSARLPACEVDDITGEQNKTQTPPSACSEKVEMWDPEAETIDPGIRVVQYLDSMKYSFTDGPPEPIRLDIVAPSSQIFPDSDHLNMQPPPANSRHIASEDMAAGTSTPIISPNNNRRRKPRNFLEVKSRKPISTIDGCMYPKMSFRKRVGSLIRRLLKRHPWS